ncbi:MAG: glycoside hydrolase family 88 protein [Bacteroidales bacterium]|nr:glycoside hydrolase family 88 protein [Bacteroidales bacterium]
MRLISSIVVAFLLLGCNNRAKHIEVALQNGIEALSSGLLNNAVRFDGTDSFPRTFENGEVVCVNAYDWTSGFFAGDLWLAYELTGNDSLAYFARHYTEELHDIKDFTGHHDLGFMIYCSYGHQWKNFHEDDVKSVIVDAATSLCTRFNPTIGQIRSWDFGEWNYPVIVDNMMNLEMLFAATKMSGDSCFFDIAVKHADKCLENHFREDASSYHVVSYNDDGSIESKGTFQGFSDESSWARGIAWTLYGFTMCFRETGFERYLKQAERIAYYIMTTVNTVDKIPYWDYNDTAIPDSPRDASAAAITASALIELSTMTQKGKASKAYLSYAEDILLSLSSPEYMADPKENGGFLLKHSVSHKPLNSEIDVPLVYADYYYLEAAQRYFSLFENRRVH